MFELVDCELNQFAEINPGRRELVAGLEISHEEVEGGHRQKVRLIAESYWHREVE